MGKFNEYTIYCTEEQTRKALELGAPIEFEIEFPINFETLERSPYPDIKMGEDGEPILINPTAEQMIGWLEEQGIIVTIEHFHRDYGYSISVIKNGLDTSIAFQACINSNMTRKEATLAAIDSAMGYLMGIKEK